MNSAFLTMVFCSFAAFPQMMTSTSSSGPWRSNSDNSSSNSKRQRRAPLVDSDLLRFLSQTKAPQQPQSRSSSQQRIAKEEGASTTTTIADSAASNNVSAELAKESAIASNDAWLLQYERHRVALLLQDAGPEMAHAAGVAVETMAVARTARRRVRSFLRERDQVWNSDADYATSSAATIPETRVVDVDDIFDTANESSATTSTNDSNNLEQVLELMSDYGLSVKDCAEILIHSPGIAFMRPKPLKDEESNGEALQQTLNRVFVELLMGRNEPWQLRLRKYDARKVLRNTPGLLSVRGSKSATQMVQLLSRLGVSSNSLSRDKNSLPVLLSRQPSAVFRLAAFLSSDDVRMPIDKIGPLLRRAECQDLLNAVAPVPRLEKQTNYDAVAAQVRREVVNNHYRNMSRTAWILRHQIGTDDLGKVVSAYPSVLLLDAAKQILPTAHYLMHELGIYRDDLPRVLQLYPALLRMDVEQMRNIVSFLTSLEVDPDNLGGIFRSFPVLLTLDIEHDMEPVVDFLRNTVGIANVGRFITRLPPILGYSVEKELLPKYKFLASVTTDPRFEVSKFPAFFSYPLERGKTRFAYLEDVKGVPTALVALDKVLCYGDRDFATRVSGDRDHGVAYQAFVTSRKQKLAPTRQRPQASLRPKAVRSRREPPPAASPGSAAPVPS